MGPTGPAGALGGANTEVQFNDNSVANASANFTFDKTTNNVTVTGNIVVNTGAYYGNGAGLSNLTGGNVSGQVGNALVAGTVYTAAQPNITSVGTLSTVSVTGNATVGGIKTDNFYYANGTAISFAGTYSNSNVQSYLPTYNGNVGGGTATFYGTTLTTGANTTAGTITGNWTLSAGSKLQATYADLAEYYAADKVYPTGTVLEFGGDFEVTAAGIESNKLAGVVSSEPAYVMNSNIKAQHPVMVALIGRVPVRVIGKVYKGDMLVSAGNGLAVAATMTPKIGTVIGKAIANKTDDGEGIVEVMVGRM